MKIVYANKKTEKQCTDLKCATKLFGGNKVLAISLHARINAIEQAEVINDIIVNKHFRFHNLKGERNGFFAIDVKTVRDKWRIVLQPLDENNRTYNPCNIDEIAKIVKVVEIHEESAHYE